MNNVKTQIDREQFLAPLVQLKRSYEVQYRAAVEQKNELTKAIAESAELNSAIPLQMRNYHLFMVESSIETIMPAVRKAIEIVRHSTTTFQSLAEDALRIDPSLREEALRTIFDTETLAHETLKVLETMAAQVDFSIGGMMVH